MAREGVFELDFLTGTDFEAGDFEVLVEGGGDEKGTFGFEFSELRKFSVDFERLCREVLGGVAIIALGEGRKEEEEEKKKKRRRRSE